MKLSVVIVSYNVAYFLEQALLSVRRAIEHLGEPAEVFVVDNNSADNSVAMVRARFPEVILLENQTNPGFAKANNQALRRASGQYCLLLNPDTLVEEAAFRRCCDFMDAHPEAGGLGVQMLDGGGRFLPESKRGLPTPAVAFYKMVGLAKLFPRSRTFGRYHLGYLSPDEVHSIEVLSGAYMWLRSAALNQVGLLDEDYFMYGEDIDLSYRLTRGGWLNYYLPTVRILHYKGESTRRTSVNYVLVFYRAMVVFARKHFAPGRAGMFSALLNAAIWLRAGAALGQRLATSLAPVLLDAALLFGGMYALKSYWEVHPTFGRGPYPPRFMLVAVPAYVAAWLGSVWLSGGYDRPTRASQVVRGVVVGTVLISAASNFLNEWRFSRALILLGGVWAAGALLGRQLLAHWLRHGHLRLRDGRPQTLAIVGSAAEAARARKLLAEARVPVTLVGRVALGPEPTAKPSCLGTVAELPELLRLYGLTELIFCGQDLPTACIIEQMHRLPKWPEVSYRILPAGSDYIIGSSRKDANGDYYALDHTWPLYRPAQRRSKRVLDLAVCLGVLAASPLLAFGQHRPAGLLPNLGRVLLGRRSWVGVRYLPHVGPHPAVLSPADVAPGATTLADSSRQRLETLYAQAYKPSLDLGVLLRGWRALGGR